MLRDPLCVTQGRLTQGHIEMWTSHGSSHLLSVGQQRHYAPDSATRSSLCAGGLHVNIQFSKRVFEKAQKKKVTHKPQVCHVKPLAWGPRLGRCSETFRPMTGGFIEAVEECVTGKSLGCI